LKRLNQEHKLTSNITDTAEQTNLTTDVVSDKINAAKIQVKPERRQSQTLLIKPKV